MLLVADSTFGIDDLFVALTALVAGVTALVVAATGLVRIMLTLRQVVRGQERAQLAAEAANVQAVAANVEARAANVQARETHRLVNSQTERLITYTSDAARAEGLAQGISQEQARAVELATRAEPDQPGNYQAEEGWR